MAYDKDNLAICSYNSTGFGLAAQDFMDKLLLFSDILCIQEHFVLDCKDRNHSNTDKIRERFNDNHDMFIVPAKKDTTQVTRGRGVGGLATIWKRSLTKYVKRINCDNSRIQATMFHIPDCPLLVINTYFPCDPRSSHSDFTELIELLGDLEGIVSNVECTNILIAGDLNCHFNRNSNFTSIVQHWINNFNLKILWSQDNERIEPVDFTFMNTTCEPFAFSTIDHFILSPRMLNGLVSAGVIHDGSNLSNHSPIHVTFEVGKIDLRIHNYVPRTKVLWEAASGEAKHTFKRTFEEKLDAISIPCECTDIHCKSEEHKEQLEEYTISVLKAMEDAGIECLPSSSSAKKKKRNIVPG